MEIELRFVKRTVQTPVRGSQDTFQEIEVKILQQRIKTGTYTLWGEWHDIPVVDEEEVADDEPESRSG